jgi:PhoH-like ATPase
MPKNLFVLDTNVLLSDPKSIYKFQEHTIYIPFIVLEELDNHKKGLTDLARLAREATRNLENLIKTSEENDEGYVLPSGGVLRFTTKAIKDAVQGDKTNDNIILNEVAFLTETEQRSSSFLRIGIYDKVILVSQDINIRVKAKALDLLAEDYVAESVTEKDSDSIGVGYLDGDTMFSDNTRERLVQLFHKNTTETITVPYSGEELEPFKINGVVVVEKVAQFKAVEQDEISVTLVPLHVYGGKHSVWGVRAKNVEQNIAMNMLMDKDKHLVVVSGQAGSGKTMIAIASGLEQVIEEKAYERIIFLRETVVASGASEIGFLPGTLDDKMLPFLGSLTDNLKQLTGFAEQPKGKKPATEKPISPLGQFENVIEINSLGLMRGSSLPKAFIIIDEAQNLTKEMVKMILTRAGEGSKIVMLGNINQIDNVYLNKYNNGMSIVVDKFEDSEIFSYIVLQETVRSKLAEEAVNRLGG